MSTPLLVGIVVALAGAVLHVLGYRAHASQWTADQRQSFWVGTGFGAATSLAVLIGLSGALFDFQALGDPLSRLSAEQLAKPEVVQAYRQYHQLLMQVLQFTLLALPVLFLTQGLALLAGEKPDLFERKSEALSPKEQFHKVLPQAGGTIALLLLLIVADQIISAQSSVVLSQGIASTTVICSGMALVTLGTLLQFYGLAYPERGRLILWGGGLLSTLGFGVGIMLPAVQQAPGRMDVLLITGVLSLGIGLALPLRTYLDGRRQAL